MDYEGLYDWQLVASTPTGSSPTCELASGEVGGTEGLGEDCDEEKLRTPPRQEATHLERSTMPMTPSGDVMIMTPTSPSTTPPSQTGPALSPSLTSPSAFFACDSACAVSVA